MLGHKITTGNQYTLDEVKINLLDLVLSISHAIDRVAPEVSHHHARVAYTALAIAREMALPQHELQPLLLASLLHDIGILSADERAQVQTFDSAAIQRHAEAGYLLLQKCRLFATEAKIVRYHHEAWSKCSVRCCCSGATQEEAIPRASHILHLADRITVLVGAEAVPDKGAAVTAAISQESGRRFAPQAVAAFVRLSAHDHFWQELNSPQIADVVRASASDMATTLDWLSFQGFAELMAQVIDFRCRFTATHSSGVAAVAARLASLADFSHLDCEKVRVAGYLHDIGKLALPKELLEKPARLSDDEYCTVQGHIQHTRNILQHITGLEDIVDWAVNHHERLDGTGYPHKLHARELSLGSRIIAVADVFTALAENRPYRSSKDPHAVMAIMRQQVNQGRLDARLVELALDDYAAMNLCRRQAQVAAVEGYDSFRLSLSLPVS